MAFIIESKTASVTNAVKSQLKEPPKLPYEIPERYRNAFYLANAAFFDSTNWFLHRALEVIFPELKQKLKLLDSHKQFNNNELAEQLENTVHILDQCNTVIDLRFPVKRDNRKYEVIRGFRAQHGLSTGCSSCLGGLRINEHITRDHMKALSVLSTYRNACMGIGMAGAFGGIKINPNDYSYNELQQIVQSYASELIQRGYCNEKDVVQPDIGCNQREMNWITETSMKHTGRKFNVVAVGNKPELGGIPNFSHTASKGVFLAINYFLNNDDIMKKLKLPKGLKNKTFIIQGLGKLGKPLAEILISIGCICIGVKDHDAYIYDPKGIDLKKLFEHKENTGSILYYDITKPHTDDKIFKEECDILILAAFQKSLICYTADNVKAKIIVEAADGAITPTAHKILTGREKLVIPDLYACSGSTIACFLEYLKNCNENQEICKNILEASNRIYQRALEDISSRKNKVSLGKIGHQSAHTVNEERTIEHSLEGIISEVGEEMFTISNQYKLGIDFRTAAYMIAIKRIYSALFIKGTLIGKFH